MSFAVLKKKAHALFNQAHFISHIQNDTDYEHALSLMDELIDDYDYNRHLIEILSVSIERWEDESKSFSAFNAAICDLEVGASVLKVIMDQHNLGVADFPEIGSGSLVSKIVNHKRRLTLDHIYALSKRFGVEAGLFL
ncbi:MAG: transcriptional regulator [Gammaproteobacteria bacterium RIFCSPHIGHO2_12_FULL_38_11]|nr:MAG: transcriptional regulator [Gammaproteobacteria bacterium RIFCSPHIGHO2_12_FULL_38_11]